MYITKASNDKKIYIIPTIIKNLWESVSWIIFWLNSNWNFMWWFMYWLSGSATTWNITLWNAVWYITVNFNWQIVKIPYYNE